MSPDMHPVGTRVWVADEVATWVKGVVAGHADGLLVVTTAGGSERRVEAGAAPLQNAEDQPVDDMTDLAFLHEPGVLWNLKQRYSSNAIYTYTGSILIAVNPFKSLPELYARPVMDAYSGGDPTGLPPHVYAIASAAYKKMREEGKGQAILVTGESGAGKTETSKLIMRYLAYLGGFKQSMWDLAAAAADADADATSGEQAGAAPPSSIEAKVLESNPLLEAFGNAKTVRNDNSSRFGKYVEINFSARGSISGACIRTYLLERSRLVHLNPGERNYHIFYQLCDGASADERSRWLLGPPSSYAYLNQSDVYTLPGVCNTDEFRHTRHAMAAIGIAPAQQEEVFRILSGLLHLGNIAWADAGDGAHANGGGAAAAADGDGALCNGTADAAAAAAAAGGCPLAPGSAAPAALAAAARLLGVDAGALARALSTRTRATPDGPITSPLDARASSAARDALVKIVYSRLFDWLVGRINASIGRDDGAAASIGLLDIYGFESFAFNDLEQFCINLANEKLQQHFNQHVFKWEQAEYEAEGIDWSYIEFVDNQDVLDLIEGKLGLVDQLDEQCRWPTATHKDLADKLFAAPNVTSSPRFSRTKRSTTSFTLQHYAGPVAYATDNFLDKNRDYVVAEHQELLGGAGLNLLAQLFAGEAQGAEPAASPGSRPGPPGALSGKSLKAFQFVSVCSHFKRQLAELMGLLNQLEPHYVRCIKPNPASKPLMLDDSYALHQLKCGGVMEAVRISCAGYPFRRTFADFLDAFWQLYPAGLAAACGGDEAEAADACRRLLAQTGMSEGADYQVGSSKVFLKAHQSVLLNQLHTRALAKAATAIQASWRCHRQRAAFMAARAAVVRMQAGARGMAARRLAASIRTERAATAVQKYWRGRQAREAFAARRAAAVALQAAWRGVAARRVYAEALATRRADAATSIQAAWRTRHQREAFQQQRGAALLLQAAWRGARVRAVWAPVLAQHRAAAVIQAAWRRHTASPVRFRCDAAAQAAALVIQQIWRERDQHNSKVRRLQAAVRRYVELHGAATAVQAAWRHQAAARQLRRLQDAERRERFKRQMAAFEATFGEGANQPASSRRASTDSAHSPPHSVAARADRCASQPGVMPPPRRAAYGVSFAGIAPSPLGAQAAQQAGAAAAASTGAAGAAVSRSPPAATTAVPRARLLPPPPPAAYGVGYAGINGAGGGRSAAAKGGASASSKPRPRGVRLFAPPPPAAYGVAYGGPSAAVSPQGEGSMRARLLEPAPPAGYGISFAGLQHSGNTSSGSTEQGLAPSSSSSSNNSSSNSASSGRRIGGAGAALYRSPTAGGGSSTFSSSFSSGAGRRLLKRLSGSSKGRADDEAAPLLEVVKADASPALAPEERLFARLGSLMEDKGRVAGLVNSWRDKLKP